MQMILYSKISELKHNNVDVLKPPNLNVIFFLISQRMSKNLATE